MKKIIAILCMFLALFAGMSRGSHLLAQCSGDILDYQNYNHGYCPTCDGPLGSCNCGTPTPPPPPVNPPPAYPSYYYNPVPPAPVPACATGTCGGAPIEEVDDAPCAPCAGASGVNCGISICALGILLIALAAGAAIIVSSGNGSNGH